MNTGSCLVIPKVAKRFDDTRLGDPGPECSEAPWIAVSSLECGSSRLAEDTIVSHHDLDPPAQRFERRNDHVRGRTDGPVCSPLQLTTLA